MHFSNDSRSTTISDADFSFRTESSNNLPEKMTHVYTHTREREGYADRTYLFLLRFYDFFIIMQNLSLYSLNIKHLIKNSV